MKKVLYARLIKQSAGYAKDIKDVSKFNIGDLFTIDYVVIGDSSTVLGLFISTTEVKDFNSVNFEVLDKNLEPYDIFRDKELNSYL